MPRLWKLALYCAILHGIKRLEVIERCIEVNGREKSRLSWDQSQVIGIR